MTSCPGGKDQRLNAIHALCEVVCMIIVLWISSLTFVVMLGSFVFATAKNSF